MSMIRMIGFGSPEMKGFIMKCNFCHNEVAPGVANCPACGAAVPPANQMPQQVVISDKSRIKYSLLGFFFGFLGVHNFYAGFTGRGVADIFCSIILTPFLVQISTGIELLTNNKDRNGNVMKGDAAVPIVLGILLIIGNLLMLGIIFLTICGVVALS